jgi:hypothetical protein
MAYRYTDTNKWSDNWFSGLSPTAKLLWNYFCDNCDIAGFIEVNTVRFSFDTGLTPEEIEQALPEISSKLIISKTRDVLYLSNFLKHQKNYPLRETNKCHKGILRRFVNYSYKFDIKDINEFIEGASKGLQSPIGIVSYRNGNNSSNNTIIPREKKEEPVTLNSSNFEGASLPVDICFEIASKDLIWSEPVCMNHHITPETFSLLLAKFTSTIKGDGENLKEISDYKKHFNRWIPKNKSSILTEIKQTPASYGSK